MHNSLSPKLCTMKTSSAKTFINIACFAQYNDFSPPIFSVFNYTDKIFTLFNNDSCSHQAVCKNIVKDSEFFKQSVQGIHLQNFTIGLKEHQKNTYPLYLAAKGNYLTKNSTIQDAQTNAKSVFSISNDYRHSNTTTHQHQYQKNCTLFLNRVLDHTGRLYIKTIEKN
jgi:hypothetical protein